MQISPAAIENNTQIPAEKMMGERPIELVIISTKRRQITLSIVFGRYSLVAKRSSHKTFTGVRFSLAT